MKTTLLWLFGGALLLAAWACTFVVAESETAVVSRLGDPRRVVTDAGLHFKWPAPIDTVARVDGRVHLLDPEPEEYLTSDNKNVIVDPFLAWSVEEPRRFLVSLRTREGAETRLEDVLRDSIGTVLGRGPFADLVSAGERERDLESVVADLTTEVARRVSADGFGVKIEIAGIKRVNFPESNKNAVFDRMRSEREAVAEEIRSEGRKEAAAIRSQADLDDARTIAAADEEALGIRSDAQAESLRIQLEAMDRYPELSRFLRAAELFEVISADSEIVLTADDPLLKYFRPGSLRPTVPAEVDDQ